MRSAPLLLVAVALPCMVAPCPASDPHDARPIGSLYAATPTPLTEQLGLFSFGIAFADMDGDGHRDLILSSGSDHAPQPLTIYLRRQPFYSKLPNGYSAEFHGHAGLATGDINGDGLNDVAVAIYMDPFHRVDHGGVRIYFGQGSIDQHHQMLTGHDVDRGYQGSAVALADIDADGDLDLIVAIEKQPGATDDLGPGHIYLNRSGRIDVTPWASSALGASNVMATDLDGDGWIDLVFRGPHLHVFYGRQTAADTVPFSSRPDWSSAGDPETLAFGLDVGPVGRDRKRSVVSASQAGLRVYRPARNGSTSPVWQAQHEGKFFSVRSIDVDDDGLPDLVGAAWGTVLEEGRNCAIPNPVQDVCYGGPLAIFPGSGQAFATAPAYVSQAETILNRLATADLLGVCNAPARETFRVAATRSVFTLADNRVQRIERVTLDGVELPAARVYQQGARYLSLPGADWVSVSPPVDAGHQLEVSYVVSPKVDIALATGDPWQGTWLFPSAFDCSTASGATAQPAPN